MTLTTHAIAGATLATLVPNYPALGFLVGFGSHYLLDAMPHWSYPVAGLEKDKENSLNTTMVISKSSYKDLFKVGTDGILGLLLSFIILGIFFHAYPLVIFMGATGGMLPDFLQFCYWMWKPKLLKPFQRLHNWAHTNVRIDDMPFIGITSQLLIIFLVVFIFKCIF
ncbi:MAG: hypothetical protein P4L63_03195 [Candidatus Pacebacteria bacterium]|nr:hypothetical protein [Candidatus Paceibacterota bacterium]